MNYWVFGLLTLLLALLSTVFWMFNAVTAIFNWLGGWAVEAPGRKPPFESDYTATFALCFAWPLLLAPVHWLNYRVLGWRVWRFVGLFSAAVFVAALGIQLWRSYR